MTDAADTVDKAKTVDKADTATQTDPTPGCTPESYSPATCAELVDTLSPEMVDREFAHLCMPEDERARRDTTKKKQITLTKHYTGVTAYKHDVLMKQVTELTYSLTRHVSSANEEMGKLRKQLAELISATTATRTLPPVPGVPSHLLVDPDQLSPRSEPGIVEVQPYTTQEGAPFKDFELNVLDLATDYDRTYPNRKVGYYGDVPYKYPGGYHKARPLSDNSALTPIIDKVRSLYPETKFNSAMVTKYEARNSCIPPHSDDEPCIATDSSIITVSLGQTRHVAFRHKPPGRYMTDRLEVRHGEIYVMSRKSQDCWDHAVPRLDTQTEPGVRISVTLRMLNKPSNLNQPPTDSDNNTAQRRDDITSSAQQQPKRVLILSDSKNADFDCSLLREPHVQAFRLPLYRLRDLSNHGQAIEQADLVLISSGVNDIRFGRAKPWTLHDHMRYLASRFPRTQFMFDSISPISMSANRFTKINQFINETNDLLFNLSMVSANFKLFDNLSFGMPHLSSDGIHLNKQGKEVLSTCWVSCILIRLNIRGGTLPLRAMFRSVAYGERPRPRNGG